MYVLYLCHLVISSKNIIMEEIEREKMESILIQDVDND